MTPQEVLKRIKSECPSNQVWYAITCDEKKQTWIRITANRIMEGTCKKKTMIEFFSLFGYKYSENVIQL
jgi:hypothetical protein